MQVTFVLFVRPDFFRIVHTEPPCLSSENSYPCLPLNTEQLGCASRRRTPPICPCQGPLHPTPWAGGRGSPPPSTGQQASCVLGPGSRASRPAPHKCLPNLVARKKRETAQGTHPCGVAAPVRWLLPMGHWLWSGWENVWPTLTGERREGTNSIITGVWHLGLK